MANEIAAVAIQVMGAFVAVMGTIMGLFSEHTELRWLAAIFVAFGLAAIFSESGRYRSPK